MPVQDCRCFRKDNHHSCKLDPHYVAMGISLNPNSLRFDPFCNTTDFFSLREPYVDIFVKSRFGLVLLLVNYHHPPTTYGCARSTDATRSGTGGTH